MSLWLVGVVLVVLLVLWDRAARRHAPHVRGDVLFVFAHPDDEAMFFTPTLLYLRRLNIRCHFLCLSTGNFAGLGRVRSKELIESARYFGITSSNVTVVDHPSLQDGMEAVWDPSLVAAEVDRYLNRAGTIRTIVTFDVRGVSLHPNHVATYHGVKKLQDSLPQGITFCSLTTRPMLSKYTGVLSTVWYALVGEGLCDFRKKAVVVVRPPDALCSFQAMRRHASQMVWFRYLFVSFSSYTFGNELEALK